MKNAARSAGTTAGLDPNKTETAEPPKKDAPKAPESAPRARPGTGDPDPNVEDEFLPDDAVVDDEEEEEADPDKAKNAGVDAEDSRGLEAQLDGIIAHLTTEGSKLTLATMLPRAKELYEQFHPETRHGGDRTEQVEKTETCPSFVAYMAGKVGVSTFTIRNMLTQADELTGLDPEAQEAALGTPLANKLSLVTRIARIPKKEVQRDLVNIYRSAGAKTAKAQLAEWEQTFKLTPPKPERAQQDDPGAKLVALIAKVADPVTATQDFTLGMPLPQLWQALGPLVEMYVGSGSVPAEALKDILALRDLRVRLAKLKKNVTTRTDVAPTAAKQFAVSDTTLDAAINNPRLTEAHVARLERLWERAVAHVQESKAPVPKTQAVPPVEPKNRSRARHRPPKGRPWTTRAPRRGRPVWRSPVPSLIR